MPSPPLSIVQSLSPRIAVLTSQDVIQSCEANGCRGLEELLRPWEGGAERVSILSSTLTPTIHPTFPLRFVSFESVYVNPTLSAPNPDITVDLISSFVGAKKPEEEQHYPLTRSLLLSSRPLASHETFNHPVGILYAVSTATLDPLGMLNKLHTQSTATAAQNVPWMDGNTVLRFYVVIHDISTMGDDMATAHELLANVKKAYGPHSTLLVINSQIEHREPPMSPDISTHSSIPLPRPFTPEQSNPSALSQVYASALSSLTLSPMAAASASLGETAVSNTPFSPSRPVRRKLYGSKLSAEDTQRLAALVRELVGQSLVPWMEARVREWNEVYHANRRGITGRLFGAGRKFFGSRPNSPAPGTSPTGYNAVKGYYPMSAVEALSRRLADFAFMLRDYKFAGGVYDSLRKDFAQDRAWRYAAGATEMYGLCQLLSHPFFLPSSPPTMKPIPFTNLQHVEITSWLEQAVTAYHQHAPATHIQLDALRITVLYYECWKMIGEWRAVGAALVKGAGEADEVPSAVMIEEAAAADVKGGKSSNGKRRRAFHLALAARRYETAGLKTYSRRCLERASQLYRISPWTSAQDRIEYSLGRQAYTLGESDVAVEHFLRLLRREDTGVPGSQAGPLQDMAQAYEQLAARPELLAESYEKLKLPTPVFDSEKTRIIPSSESSYSGKSREKWTELEGQVLSTWDRKGKKPMTLLPDAKRIVVGEGETFQVELVAVNPLNSPVVLTDITLTIDPTEDITVETISEISLEPYETRVISLSVTPSWASTIHLSNVTFLFHRFFPCVQALTKKGRRLHGTKAQRLNPTYAEDTSLTVNVTSSRAGLHVELEGFPDRAYAGEEVEGRIRLFNRGKTQVENVGMIWNHVGLIRRKEDTKHSDTPFSIPNLIQPNTVMSIYQDKISPGEEREIPVIITLSNPRIMDMLGLITFSNPGDDPQTFATTVSYQIESLPIINVEAQVRLCEKTPLEFAIILETTNMSSEILQIDGVKGVSPIWETNPVQSFETLFPNQVLRSIIPVKKELSTKTDLCQSATIEALSKLVQGQPLDEISASLDSSTSIAGPSISTDDLPSYLAARRSHRLQQLTSSFPTISSISLAKLFPLIEPLDLDLVIKYSISDRQGQIFIHSLHPSPAFSLVEEIRKTINIAIASGNKSTRTMYEETSRLRQVLMDSVLDGVLAKEDDPVQVRIRVGERGKVKHDFKQNVAKKLPVNFEISNSSPLLPVRWILKLPRPSTTSLDNTLSPAQYTGLLTRKGTLKAGEKEEVIADLWIHEPCSIDLGGWELSTETGDVVDGLDWVVRNSWNRTGDEKILHVEDIA
ncbi:uncharacterized protein IL334_002612 [Kwoniella shivajii]|uniref:TPPC8 first Ig-like domain-containing protein n=1 Tax=Kwoniella shivajii TaxID=564305 RepID=A0ABZ1CZE6_9TREE|nr:hypothetical protein IL334_002612 [Kwoniella shivajii]